MKDLGKFAKNDDPDTYTIIGAAMEVHRVLGCGFLEGVYQDALAKEFVLRRIPFEREIDVPVYYKQQRLAATFRPDFICGKTVIVELKALQKVGGAEEAQVLNYLKATGLRKGLLLNFGAPSLFFRRYVFDSEKRVENPQITQMDAN